VNLERGKEQKNGIYLKGYAWASVCLEINVRKEEYL
jgi:hypothetical protein